MPVLVRRHSNIRCILALMLAGLAGSTCGTDITASTTTEAIQLTAAQLASLDSTGQVLVEHNPASPELEALLDSTLQTLTAGVEAKRLAITTNLTSAPLYFVGIHRLVFYPISGSLGGSFSTWTLLGFDDPSHLVNLVEVSGFAHAGSGPAPATISGTIGDGTGFVNALFLRVGTGGAVTEWLANGGTVSFRSDSSATGAACPGFTRTAVSCSIETMHVHFNATAASGTGGAGPRQATISTDVDVPTMQLTYLYP